MKLDDGIRRQGFRTWYSRELTRAHLQLVLLLLSAVGALATVELVSEPALTAERLGNLVLLVVCIALGIRSLRRYFFLLMRAEAVASQAVCPGCRAYGLLDLQHPSDSAGQVTVRCRKCDRRWKICDVGMDL